jgi:hypothetical protein
MTDDTFGDAICAIDIPIGFSRLFRFFFTTNLSESPTLLSTLELAPAMSWPPSALMEISGSGGLAAVPVLFVVPWPPQEVLLPLDALLPVTVLLSMIGSLLTAETSSSSQMPSSTRMGGRRGVLVRTAGIAEPSERPDQLGRKSSGRAVGDNGDSCGSWWTAGPDLPGFFNWLDRRLLDGFSEVNMVQQPVPEFQEARSPIKRYQHLCSYMRVE